MMLPGHWNQGNIKIGEYATNVMHWVQWNRDNVPKYLSWALSLPELPSRTDLSTSPNCFSMKKPLTCHIPPKIHPLSFKSIHREHWFASKLITLIVLCPETQRIQPPGFISYHGTLSNLFPSQCHVSISTLLKLFSALMLLFQSLSRFYCSFSSKKNVPLHSDFSTVCKYFIKYIKYSRIPQAALAVAI